MSKEELKRKLDELVGLVSTIDGETLVYESSTGVLLFELQIFDDNGCWQFGGKSDALPGLWHELCKAGRR